MTDELAATSSKSPQQLLVNLRALIEECESLRFQLRVAAGDLAREKRQIEAKTKMLNNALEENRVMRDVLKYVVRYAEEKSISSYAKLALDALAKIEGTK